MTLWSIKERLLLIQLNGNRLEISSYYTVYDIIRSHPSAHYIDRWEVAELLKEAVERGGNEDLLNEYINIRMVSIVETSEHAAKSYLSTLAVLQLDSILVGAKKVAERKSKADNKNQKPFE